MELKIAICDDNEVICDDIKGKLLNLNPDYEIEIYHSGIELLMKKEIYHIIFLDIQMDKLNGMETARLLRAKENNECIIFISGYTEYMPDAFKVKAFRFLKKPIEINAFREAVEAAEREIINEEKVVIHSEGAMQMVKTKDIVYMEAYGDGTYIYLKNEVIKTNQQLKYWCQKVGTDLFFQVHRSYIVSLKYVKRVQQSEIIMDFVKIGVPLSRRRKTLFKRALMEYMRRNIKYL